MNSASDNRRSCVDVFLVEFRKLKSWIDDQPDDLVNASIQDESIRDQCGVVRRSELKLKKVLGISDFEAALNDVNQFQTADFVKNWRDYEARYMIAVQNVVLGKIFGLSEDDLTSVPRKTKWDQANQHGADRVH